MNAEEVPPGLSVAPSSMPVGNGAFRHFQRCVGTLPASPPSVYTRVRSHRSSEPPAGEIKAKEEPRDSPTPVPPDCQCCCCSGACRSVPCDSIIYYSIGSLHEPLPRPPRYVLPCNSPDCLSCPKESTYSKARKPRAPAGLGTLHAAACYSEPC
jgi:hypothetical protein